MFHRRVSGSSKTFPKEAVHRFALILIPGPFRFLLRHQGFLSISHSPKEAERNLSLTLPCLDMYDVVISSEKS